MINYAFIALLMGACAPVALGAVMAFDESIQGDLSDDYLIPNVFQPDAGTFSLKGSVVNGDRDLFTMNLTIGLSINSIKLISYSTDSDNPDNVSYFLSQPGSTLSAPPTSDFAQPIGYVGFGKWAENREVLRIMTAGPPYDYANSLGTGSYAFWINETGPLSSYEFRFTIVPEPSISILLLTASALLLRRKRNLASI